MLLTAVVCEAPKRQINLLHSHRVLRSPHLLLDGGGWSFGHGQLSPAGTLSALHESSPADQPDNAYGEDCSGTEHGAKPDSIVFVEIVIVLDLCPVSVLIVAGLRCSRSRDWSGLRRIVFGCWRGRGSRCSAMLRLFCFGCR